MVDQFFMSHNHLDKPLVLKVHQCLKSMGFDVWTDRFEIKVGDSLIQKVFDSGLKAATYVCAFITENSKNAPWVREELEHAYVKSLQDGKPKILPLCFDNAEVPEFLRSKLYGNFRREEVGEVVEAILDAAGHKSLRAHTDAAPLTTLDFHDAVRDERAIFLLASRKDALDFEPFFDPEGVVFHRRHFFIIRSDLSSKTAKFHYLTKARVTHTAMRVFENELIVFLNEKVHPNSFSMVGRRYQLLSNTLRPTAVSNVFENQNWGWSPWIDEHRRVHHADSSRSGNPYLIECEVQEGKNWTTVNEIGDAWRSVNRPYPSMPKSKDRALSGYLNYIDVDPSEIGQITA